MRVALPRTTFARLVALLVALTLVAAACGGGGGDGDDTAAPGGQQGDRTPTEDGEPVVGGTLVDLQNFSAGNPEHIDPGLSSVIQGSQIAQLVFDGLTENDYQTGELQPMVAESWESNDAGDEWTFQLREGVTFHNGDPVLPSDFKFAWERVVNPEFASDLAYHLDPIVGSDAVADGETTELEGVVADDDAMTLTVSLQFPYSTFPASVSHSVFSPVPKDVVEALDDQSQWERDVMIGNGPFKMSEPWADERSIKLERYDDYWGGLNGHTAYLDAIDFRISSDLDSAFQAFEAGQGDTGYIPPGRFEEVLTRFPDQNATDESLGIYYFGFNMDDPVVGGEDNLLLRQAIALAIDKQAIVDTVYSGSRTVATGWTPPGLPGYEEGLDDIAGAAERDLDRARQLLEDWGGEVTEPIQLNFNAGAGHEPVAQIIQANLEEIGIPSTLDGRDSTTYFTQMRAGEGQFFRAGWIWDYVAYDNGLYPLFHSDSIGGDNLMQYSNPEVDKLIDEARATLDEDDANERYREAEEEILEDVAVVPLNWYTGSIVYDKAVKNFIQSPLQFVAYDEIWLDE
ncbi:MAG: ABC transporter substrate-binding protein [Actinobacteria bacterium]|nr:ABC transporter substrate-binding protein [Actinomycetota bacterium]